MALRHTLDAQSIDEDISIGYEEAQLDSLEVHPQCVDEVSSLLGHAAHQQVQFAHMLVLKAQ